MSAGPTDTLEQRNNVLVGPADVTSVYKTDVTSVAATDLAAGGCNQYNPFGGASRVPLLDSNLESNISISPNVQYLPYIGVLLYLAQGTRPDIAYVTHYLARFSLNPNDSHWEALRRLVGYVRSTAQLELVVEPVDSGGVLRTYVDASWMGEGARLHHGYITTLWSVLLAWNAKRQTVIAKSTCQAEYVALSKASDKAIWMAGIVEPLIGKTTPTLLCDNKAAVKIAKNAASMKKTKNIQRKFHATNEHLRKGEIELEWIPGAKQLADCFTKALGANLVRKFNEEIYGGKERLK
jgi:hypothetical protein